ncbi:MAG: hypothetical protein IJW53_06085 [Clostridia bacterium]|nr:hypothetical protein [Clostridia bacterium]
MGSEVIFNGLSAYDLGYAIGMILGSLFLAFLSFRFYKPLIVLEMAFMGYALGAESLGALVSEETFGFSVAPIFGIAVAIILAIFSFKIYKGLIYFLGGMLGFLIGMLIPSLIFEAFGLDWVGLLVGLIVGILLARPGAKLMMKIMKPLYIFSSSVGGMTTVFYYLGMLIVGEESGLMLIFSLAGLALGIYAMTVQFKMNKDRAFEL